MNQIKTLLPLDRRVSSIVHTVKINPGGPMKYIEDSIEWKHEAVDEPLRIFFHFYDLPEVAMGDTPDGLGDRYREMSRLVITDVLYQHESIFSQLSHWIPSWEEWDEFVGELDYMLKGDCA